MLWSDRSRAYKARMTAATRGSLAAEFKALGVGPGDLVMLHASFKSPGPVRPPGMVLDGMAYHALRGVGARAATVQSECDKRL